VLRILFSTDDLARTRVAPSPDPVWELVLSLHLLQEVRPSTGRRPGQAQDRGRDDVIDGWRREVRDALRRDGRHDAMRLLLGLNPPHSYFPDFLTPSESRYGLAAGLEALRATPAARLRRDLSLLREQRPLPPSAPALARGEPEVLRHLTDAMAAYGAAAVEPYQARVQAAVAADRARRARAVLDGGTEGLLASLRPSMRWAAGVLEVPDYPSTRDLHLAGRGLLLVPSFFCHRIPVALVDPTLPPVLVYPVDRLGGLPSRSEPGTPAQRQALVALLGRTRAQVLAAIGEGSSTGEIARRLGISPAAASQHATVLRNAGLLVTQRDRNTVLHTLTPLGLAMLETTH
jgi:DNA-binding transcriptional ArsR family regulator